MALSPIQVATLEMVQRLIQGITNNTMMSVASACKTIRWATYVIENRKGDADMEAEEADGS